MIIAKIIQYFKFYFLFSTIHFTHAKIKRSSAEREKKTKKKEIHSRDSAAL